MLKNCVICKTEFEAARESGTTCSGACDRKEFHGFVKAEADNLRTFAKSEELARLDFSVLQPKSKTLCIYGQMTGDCYSDRAYELLNLCTVPYSTTASMVYKSRKDSFVKARDFSPIETYLCLANSKNKNVVAYIKGESKSLQL